MRIYGGLANFQYPGGWPMLRQTMKFSRWVQTLDDTMIVSSNLFLVMVGNFCSGYGLARKQIINL